MTLSRQAIEELLRAMFPAGGEHFELRLADGEEPVSETESGGVQVRVLLLSYETDGERHIRDVKEQEVYLLNAAERADAARTTAYLRAWARALPAIGRHYGGEVDTLMPLDLFFWEALAEAGVREEADFAALFESAEWLARCCRQRERDVFADEMRYLGVGEHAEQLYSLRRPSIRLVVDAEQYVDEDDRGWQFEDVEEDDAPVGISKIGGLPDLPPGVAWPTIEEHPLSFLAQVRLADLRGLAGAEDLPDSGLLLFFYDADGRTNHDADGKWCWPARHRGGARVIHFEGDPATFVRAERPDDHRLRVFHRYTVERFDGERMMPPMESPFYDVLDDEPHDNPWFFKFSRVAETSEHDPERPIHRLLGYISELQGDPYLEAHRYSTGQDFEGGDRDGAREREILREATKWRLLLQIDSEPGDLLNQDGGYYYFLIHEDDLAARRFDRVWGIAHMH
ncbi:YwqG family protein [Nannocystis punicea]|uniref:YwqG family protein n=1 Tax=Nannocystis punicea TaxID=2995304 RepID=A0ABY7H6L6_9BACT|nr:YwqG family protein [Nannocystis poenicansa]WAS94919.1 YwqG family protein [Nannocystis poenicansa]